MMATMDLCTNNDGLVLQTTDFVSTCKTEEGIPEEGPGAPAMKESSATLRAQFGDRNDSIRNSEIRAIVLPLFHQKHLLLQLQG